MRRMKKIFFLVLLLSLSGQAFPYDISVVRRNIMIRDQRMLLVKQQGQGRKLVDTADYDPLTRSHRFVSDAKLEPGFYEIQSVTGGGFEFLIDSDSAQNFTVTVDF